MATYKYNGHNVNVEVTGYGMINAYLDGDLEPIDISEGEYQDIVTNGTLI